MQINSKINHSNIYFAGLILLTVVMPFSNLLMSIAQIILILNWIVGGNLKAKFNLFLKNKTALVLSGVFIIHVFGLLYSSNWVYGLEDVKKKIPLLLLPLIISSSPGLSKEKINWILKFFLLSVFIATLSSTIVFLGLTGVEITDIRQISLFISNIRFSLMIAMGFFIAIYFFFNKHENLKYVFGLAAIWLICFLVLMESLTGLIITSFVALTIFFFWVIKQPGKYKVFGLLFLFGILIIPPVYVALEIKDFYSPKRLSLDELEIYSAGGEVYIHDIENQEIENGNYVRIYIAMNELTENWNQRSQIAFDSIDRKGHFIKYTIMRFLTSKGLRKDAQALKTLTQEEIIAIENGVANVDYQEKSSLHDRIRQVIWEVDWYFKGYDPSGHSVSMRFEFWRTALGIIKGNILTGVGTGDPLWAFSDQYLNNNTQLNEKFRHRSHNQFLAIAVALGLIGLIYFLFSLVYPFISEKNSKNYFYLVFFVIAIFSMISEDTLETQAGVTFFAFFNSLLLLGARDEK
ncbi:MAG: O-antigen ligase family protein [Bacteroidetes bacterium]|nr:O-antigen ligase family protein [Bacteroidota bacterium]HET6244720.1 O-antigen ligase family protein [Bacteroidia bacterium]